MPKDNSSDPDGAQRVDGRGIREVKSAARTVQVLELLAARRHQPARLRDLSDALDAPRSSVYALLKTLVDYGWVRTDATGTFYSIGIQALLAGTTYLDVDPVLRIVQPQINELSTRLNETIHYGRLEGTDIVYLATHESTQHVRPFSRVGRRLPAFSTAMGKALLAELVTDEPSLEAHLPAVLTPLTPRTIADRTALRHELDEVQARGYAVDDEENVVGIFCLAFALDFGGTPTDAISCSVPVERHSDRREAEILEALRRTKLTIERMAPVAAPAANAWA